MTKWVVGLLLLANILFFAVMRFGGALTVDTSVPVAQAELNPDKIRLMGLKTLMQVNELTPADKALFVEATRPVYAQFEASVGKDFLDFTRQQLCSA